MSRISDEAVSDASCRQRNVNYNSPNGRSRNLKAGFSSNRLPGRSRPTRYRRQLVERFLVSYSLSKITVDNVCYFPGVMNSIEWASPILLKIGVIGEMDVEPMPILEGHTAVGTLTRHGKNNEDGDNRLRAKRTLEEDEMSESG